MSMPTRGDTRTAPAYRLPSTGGNPSSRGQGTTPGSFALAGQVGRPRAFSSPDSPGMPAPSSKTAWDFMPPDWKLANGRWEAPDGFVPVTQLEHARLGHITPQMQRVAEREPHLTAEQVRDEVAAGRMVIPANPQHLRYRLDPMCIGRASRTKINANIGASPINSDMEEEVEKMRWAERWQSDTVMDLSTGGDLDATREAILRNATLPVGTVPIYSMIIGRIDIISNGDEIRCPGGCPPPNPPGSCFIHADGVSLDRDFATVGDADIPPGATLTCACTEPVETCPLPSDPAIDPCAALQSNECTEFATATEHCFPTCVNFQNNAVTALECACADKDECHVEVLDGTVPTCTGGCPAGEECIETVTDNAAMGGIDRTSLPKLANFVP